jgi:hypothetical protein
MARYRPPTNLPTDPAQLAAVLLEHLRRISEDLGTIPTDDVNTVIVQERVDVPAGSTRRISPPTTGGIAVLEAPGPNNVGKRSTIIIENPAGSLKVVASPHRAADGKITASTINADAQATYTLPGVVTFTSNGVDSWKTQVEAPAETAPSTATAGLLEALEGTFHVQTADANLPNARVATSSDTIEVDHTTGGQAKWNVKQANSHVVALSVTQNAMAFPAGFVNGDTFDATTAAGNVTINGIDATGIDPGFEFILRIGTSSGNATSITHESGSATDATYRINTPNNVTQVLGEDCGVLIRRASTRWLIIANPPAASTSIAYSGQQLQRAALTGFAAASANSNATTSAEPIVTYSSSGNMSAERVTTSSTSVTVSTSVASQIEFQRAALTGDVTASANSNATTIANDAVTNAKAANMAEGTIKGRALAAGTGDPTDLTAAQAAAIVAPSLASTSITASSGTLVRAALTGDVTAASNSNATTIANDAVTVSKLAHGGIGQTLVSFGSFADPMWCHVLTEQFFGGGATTTISGQWGWGVSNITEQDTLGPEPGHSGIRRYLRAGGTHGYVYAANVAADLGEIDIADVAFLYFVVRIPNTGTQTDLTGRRYFIGLAQDASDTSGSTPDLGGNGIGLHKPSISASWVIRDENASSTTTTTTETAVLDDWVECLLVNEGSGNWGILVNGVDHGTHAGVVSSGVMTPVISIDSTASDLYFDVDEFTIGFLPSANRYG